MQLNAVLKSEVNKFDRKAIMTQIGTDLKLEHLVVPVCKYIIENDKAVITKSLGTAFFISSTGIFLTAKHVVATLDQNVGLCVKDLTLKNVIAPIKALDVASDNIDITAGKIEYTSVNWFELEGEMPACWQDIATLGYPETAMNVTPEKYNIHLRAHKGYIQRIISPNEAPDLKPHRTLLELNFPISLGLSGAPLFKAKGNKNILLGVCIGSCDSELIQYEYIEIKEDGTKNTERTVKVEQFGIAQDITEILNWSPNFLNGNTISDIFNKKA